MQDVIKENRDFHRIYRRGKCAVSPMLISYIAPSRSAAIRIGITSSKKIGGAVVRNRARRVIRAAFRECAPHIKFGIGADIVFVARSRTADAKSTEVAKVMLSQLAAAGLAEEV